MNTTTVRAASAEEAAYLQRLAEAREASWPSGLPREPVYPLGEIALGDLLRRRAELHPDKIALNFYGRRFSYAEIDRLSEKFANLLSASGVRAGDRVAVYLQNCPQYVFVFYGILKLGAVHVPVNPMFREHELRHELQTVGAKVIVVLDQLLPFVRAVSSDCPLDLVLATSMEDLLPDVPDGPLPPMPGDAGMERGDALDLMKAVEASSDARVAVAVDLDAVAALNFTGGTTGLPKACTHSQRDMLYTCATGGRLCYELDENSVVLCFVPLFWIAGEGIGLLMPVFFGGTLVLHSRWNAPAFTAAVERYGVSHVFMMVDNAMEILADEGCATHDISSLRHVKTASFVNRITPELRERWRERTGAPLHEVSWGMTETHTYDFFTTGFQDGNRDLGYEGVFVGLCVPGTEVKIRDFETGALMPPGEPGEIVVRSPSVTRGYWQPDGQTEPALDADGWFSTGDSGVVHPDGTMSYLGRRKEMIKVRGMSVFPSELEVIIAGHPAVESVAVVPRPDPVKGQVPVAFVKPVPGERITAEALTAWAREQFASYKQPEFRLIEAFPVTFSGKIRKNALIEQYICD